MRCMKYEETTILLNRYLNGTLCISLFISVEDLSFIVKKALEYHSGDLHTRVVNMSNVWNIHKLKPNNIINTD